MSWDESAKLADFSGVWAKMGPVVGSYYSKTEDV